MHSIVLIVHLCGNNTRHSHSILIGTLAYFIETIAPCLRWNWNSAPIMIPPLKTKETTVELFICYVWRSQEQVTQAQ